MATLAILGLLIAAAPAGAIVITGGPTYSPGGGWSCTGPVAGTEKLTGGGNYSCSGSTGAFTNLYIGINKNTGSPFGDDMNSSGGSEPTGAERFVWSANGSTFIRYTGQTTISTFGTVFTRVTLTFGGTGAVVDDATTQALTGTNINGSVHALWRIGSAVSSMTINVLVEASTSASGPFQPADVFFGTPSTHRPGDGSTDVDRSHVDLAFYTSTCGDSQVDGTEQCDVGGSNGSGTFCCTATCQFRGSGQVCRTSAGVCDVQETCTGSSGTCPANGFMSSSTTCRPSAGVCDPAENCTGSSAACPSNTLSSSATVCRASAGVCDTAENCTGSSVNCPADDVEPSTTECRSAADVCDVAEDCDGVGVDCPADAVAPATQECRPSAGSCDVPESCDGANVACPADVVAPSTQLCRASAGVCDVDESCDGVTGVCPPDGFAPATQVCRGSAGVCDVAETCTGSSADCPADSVEPAAHECRAAVDVCDAAENCDGASVNCPADAVAPATQECRPSAGVCDVAENCTGTGTACPSDAFEPATTTCRPSAGDCDVAETCSGSGAACPADAVQPTTHECRADTGDCDVAENCDGTTVTCPADASEPDGTSCSDANSCTINDVCAAGVCTGDSMLCGDGTVQSGCGEQCDDGGTTAGDGCSPTCQVEPGLGCAAFPLPGCRDSFIHAKSQVQLTDKSPDSKDKLKWKWLGGAATTTADFGNPATTTDYQLCIYDSGGLVLKARAPHAGVCAARACWKAAGSTGFKYKDKDLTPNGIAQISLKAGVDGKAKIQVQGKGTFLDMPSTSSLTQPVTVQIQNTNGKCWQSVFSAPPIKQTSEQFLDKAD